MQFPGVAILYFHKIPARHPFPALLSRDEGFSSPFLPAVHIDSRQLDTAHSATVWTLIPASLGYIVRQKI